MHNCGHCMYHYSKKCTNKLGGSVTNKRCYWYCGHPDKKKKENKKWSHGENCELFEDRYENPKKVDEWIREVNKRLKGGRRENGNHTERTGTQLERVQPIHRQLQHVR